MAKKKQNQAEKEMEREEKGIPTLDYTDKEMEYRGFMIKRLEEAKDQSTEKYTEIDDMDRLTYYDTNAKAANSYNKPTINPEDKKIVTGTTLEKDNALLNSVLNLNLEPDIESYSKDDLPVQQLGDAMETMVKKSRKMEDYDTTKRRLFYKEIIDQGNVFVEDVIIDKKCVEKELKNKDFDPGDLSSITWSERISKVYKSVEANMIHGCKVFLGNMKEFFMDKQPYIFTVEYLSRAEAENLFGEWERWKYVPEQSSVEVDEETTEYNNWRLYDLFPDRVEVIKYQDKWANEYQIMLNGIMMLPTGFPLSAITGDGEYSIVKGDLEPISRFFALSKSFPAKVKVPQAVLDEFLRLMVLKAQKGYAPSFANTSNRVLSRRIFLPGTITPGIAKDQLTEIGKNDGIQQGDIAAYEFISNIIDESTVSSQFATPGDDSKKTATQATLDQKQNMLKIGLAILGIIDFERQLVKRRIVNVLRAWTTPIDKEIDSVRGKYKDIFMSISSEAEFQGKKGIRMVKLNEDNSANTPESIMQEEDMYSQIVNKPVRITYIRPSFLKNLKNKWYIEITPTEKETSELKKAMFIEGISQTVALFGIESVNLEGLKERWAQYMGESEDVLFKEGQQSMSPMAMGGQPGAPGGQQGMPKPPQTQRPTVNTMKGAA